MSGDSEYEPKDSRNVTGTAKTKDGRWSDDSPERGHGNGYAPADSRIVTGTKSAPHDGASDEGDERFVPAPSED